MSVGPESEAKIAALLYDSHYAGEGADLALRAGNYAEYERLKKKERLLYHKARLIDPAMNAEAWKE